MPEMSIDQLVEQIRHLDYLIHISLDKTDSGLGLVTSHFG